MNSTKSTVPLHELKSNRGRTISRMALHLLCASTTALLMSNNTSAFVPMHPSGVVNKNGNNSKRHDNLLSRTLAPKSRCRASGVIIDSSTALNIWFFGGTNTETDQDSCELVAVRIERTSLNSRRIAGEILIPKPMDDVWAILTDYDNLAIHVPNLVESRRVNPSSSDSDFRGVQGDGEYRCRLFQKGAQKIVGFEFAASVTMDMAESVTTKSSGMEHMVIDFKCVESQFFSTFDGTWSLTRTPDPDNPTEFASKLEYIVDVRPRGPVPVQALEWRIENDVPTNLRAVKAASIDMGRAGVLALRDQQRRKKNGSLVSMTSNQNRTLPSRSINSVASSTQENVNSVVTSAKEKIVRAASSRKKTLLAPVRINWYEDETMATYLDN